METKTNQFCTTILRFVACCSLNILLKQLSTCLQKSDCSKCSLKDGGRVVKPTGGRVVKPTEGRSVKYGGTGGRVVKPGGTGGRVVKPGGTRGQVVKSGRDDLRVKLNLNRKSGGDPRDK